MDESSYKDFKTSRGINYHYFFSQPSDSNKPYLIFIHGFPSTSRDWRHQVEFFKAQGYGTIAPDMLGYGGTSKPTDPNEYKPSLIAKDIVEVLDHEKVEKVIAIGHDWGSAATGRIANIFPERFLGFGFFAMGYRPPALGAPIIPFETLNNMVTQLAGYELFGYWKFFSEEGADKIIEEHIDSFLNLCFAEDTNLWIDYLGKTDGAKTWVSEGRTTKIGGYCAEEDYQLHKEALLKGGMAAPLSYYKVGISSLLQEDAQSVKPENISISKPVFFGAALRDKIGIPALQLKQIGDSCKDLTTKEFDTGHWVMMEKKDEVNMALLEWIQQKF